MAQRALQAFFLERGKSGVDLGGPRSDRVGPRRSTLVHVGLAGQAGGPGSLSVSVYSLSK